jgi:DNA polymerase III subunit gamma/tau
MNYQVLARKWRPCSFEEVVGQQHVVQALANGLKHNRLHHAYLLTGTRGTGKTTIARILAKCLNCEQGITATPCGQCLSCHEITAGRFLDLIEVDAASRTRVEDTRELLENVQYAPTKARYKIYIIDEVHMLSAHSFNALLKTLEEPPPHVIFILATTDPQRLPLTVLSRCLQFHMKNLPPEYIGKHLCHILDRETITYEMTALQKLARAASGSMRDALSLLDQAIAYGNNQVKTTDVQNMLGMIESNLLLNLLNALINNDTNAVLTLISELAETGADFAHVLEELLSVLHQIALYKAVPEAPCDLMDIDKEQLSELSQQVSSEDVQLYYQIALVGRRDLPLAPTPRSGFEMILLRMLMFRHTDASASSMMQSLMPQSAPEQTPVEASTATAEETTAMMEWSKILAQLNLKGSSFAVASHCSLLELTDTELHLLLDVSQSALLNSGVEQRICQAVQEYFKKPIKLLISVGKPVQDTPAILEKKKREQQQENAVRTIMSDGNVQAIINMFNAKLIPGMAQFIDDYNFSET